MIYMTSSTAETMKGGLRPAGRGLDGERWRLGGNSSSWKAFSTERRRKKVESVVKGRIRRSWILVERRECVMTGERVAPGGESLRER